MAANVRHRLEMGPRLRSLSGETVSTDELEGLIMVFSNVSREQARQSIVSWVYDKVLEPSPDWSQMRVN